MIIRQALGDAERRTDLDPFTFREFVAFEIGDALEADGPFFVAAPSAFKGIFS